MNRALYPSGWDQIATFIKSLNSWQCAHCGKQCRRPYQSVGDFIEDIRVARVSECPVVLDFLEHPTRFILTVAHLNHRPEDCRPENLLPLCAPCHCRYDTTPTARAIKRRLKAERYGQLSLGGDVCLSPEN